MYNQYYTSADCTVYLIKNDNQILLDKMNGIMISEELSSYPIYGLGNSYFGFTTRGNYLVNGLLDLNFIHSAYLTNAIARLNDSHIMSKIQEQAQANLSNPDLLKKMSVDELIKHKQNADIKYSIQNNSFNESAVHQYGIAYLKSGFSIKILFNNTNALRNDGTKSSIQIDNCRIISSDISASVTDESQLVRRYKFIGQQINEQ